MNIILALIVFSLIILFHEFGHFLLAKLNGVTVVEFSLGMGPRIVSFKKGGTRYSWKLLPFGGSCMMLGEDADSTEEGAFGTKSVWARISVIAAGPIFNFILAFLMALFIVGSIGYDAPVLVGVTEGSPAAEAGLQAGDLIRSMNGQPIHVARGISNYTMFHRGQTVQMVWERDGETYSASVTPKDDGEGNVLLGISVSSNYRTKATPWQTVKYSFYEVQYWIRTTIESLKMMVQGRVSLNDMSGPVGVVSTISETVEESKADGAFYVWLNLLNIAILLSANLGVMNLLPLPALDGGRLVFLIVEAIRGKRIDPEKEGMVHFIGLMALLVLMVVVMVSDVSKLL